MLKDKDSWMYDPAMKPKLIRKSAGFYNKKVILTEPIKAIFFTEESPVVQATNFAIVDLEYPIEKFTVDLEWIEAWE